MKPIAVLRNDPIVPPGFLEASLDASGAPMVLARLDAGEEVPAVGDVAGVVALGGTMGVDDVMEHPYLANEARLLVDAVEAGVPVLGICLGAQLLADALGGKAYRAERPEATYVPVRLSPEGVADPVSSGLANRHVLRLHQDTWDPPPGATRLASGGGFEQGFRIGSAVGIQPHPEADPAIVRHWLSTSGADRIVRRAGADPGELGAAADVWHDEGEEAARAVFGAWLASR